MVFMRMFSIDQHYPCVHICDVNMTSVPVHSNRGQICSLFNLLWNNLPEVILASPVSQPCSVEHSSFSRLPAALWIAPSTKTNRYNKIFFVWCYIQLKFLLMLPSPNPQWGMRRALSDLHFRFVGVATGLFTHMEKLCVTKGQSTGAATV